jgi:hypothetical protein
MFDINLINWLVIDNLALVNIVYKRTSKSRRIMALVRPIVLYAMRYGIQFKVKHIEGTTNQLADSLSRFQDERFRALVPDAEVEPEDPFTCQECSTTKICIACTV